MTAQTPGGPGPPCCMGVGLGDSVPVDFHEEKIGTFSGSPGAKLPAAFLLPFVAEDKRKWPRSRYLFWVGLRSLCADKPQQKSGLSATFFLHTKKEGKDVPRGFPPWNPQAACRFSHHENRRGRRLLNQRYTRRGPGPPGVRAVIMIYFYLSSVIYRRWAAYPSRHLFWARRPFQSRSPRSGRKARRSALFS